MLTKLLSNRLHKKKKNNEGHLQQFNYWNEQDMIKILLVIRKINVIYVHDTHLYTENTALVPLVS